ncbi:WD40 repeat-like protein [Laetiporus sulphureus 93-53]|uniref:WD40 repeat-like protein n=1 Tax=Laetiporus sulphureus 93-53 TaxID=1314785 RepID=A0A165ID73_9APHY|nr:WD40 repeat-like protein [Laetiporus sulphureus 93-53]KZT12918.1 WD40 repeat-like protein [Laetiporus sulphureus 93-53]
MKVSTRPILETFVSSSKTDLYRFHPDDARSFMTIPYCLSYTHEAKRGGKSLLAVATDQGSVHVVNTSKRQNWNCGTSFISHANGIFDVQWSPSDTLLATASGDQTVGISTLESSVSPENRIVRVLEGHSSTVKCVAWEPSRDGDILCSGSRDGTIHVWDLRTECRAGSDGRSGAAIMVLGAHEPEGQQPKRRIGKSIHTPRSVTGIAYTEGDPYRLISSGSCDGILRQWDLRQARGKELQYDGPTTTPLCMSSLDPTTLQGTRRPRGITSIVPGRGPTAGLLFALGRDSRIHTYSLPSLDPLSGYVEAQDPWTYTHPDMQTNSFYVHLALSPCGRWLANGNACDGRVFLFDVSNAASSRHARSGGAPPAVQLRGHVREAGSLDWADGMLATSSEDTTVRVWRPNMEVSRRCHDDNEEMEWEWSWATN